MSPSVFKSKDFLAGALYAGVGLAALLIARSYALGTATHMGPAYFPSVLGGLLLLIGVIAIVRAFLRPGETVDGFALKAVVLVLAATTLFGLLLKPAGLVPAIVVLVITSAYASIKFRWWPTLCLAAALAAFCVLTFVKGLGIPLPILGPWFGG